MAVSRVEPGGFCEELAGWMAVMDSADRELAGGRVGVGRVGKWGDPSEAKRSETSEKPARERDHARGARPSQEMRRPSREQASGGAAGEAQTSRSGRKRQGEAPVPIRHSEVEPEESLPRDELCTRRARDQKT